VSGGPTKAKIRDRYVHCTNKLVASARIAIIPNHNQSISLSAIGSNSGNWINQNYSYFLQEYYCSIWQVTIRDQLKRQVSRFWFVTFGFNEEEAEEEEEEEDKETDDV
jgi:hypothetical protein